MGGRQKISNDLCLLLLITNTVLTCTVHVVSAQSNPFCVGRTCESKNGGDPQQPYIT